MPATTRFINPSTLPTPRGYSQIDVSSGGTMIVAGHAQWISFLRNLRACGVPVRDIRAYARLVGKGHSTCPARQSMLAAHRARVVATIETLQKHRAMRDRKLRAGCAPTVL